MSSQKEQQDADACGAHNVGDAIPGSRFDYTCDDCMLPWNWLDFDQDPAYIKYMEDHDSKDIKKRIHPGRADEKNEPSMESDWDNLF